MSNIDFVNVVSLMVELVILETFQVASGSLSVVAIPNSLSRDALSVQAAKKLILTGGGNLICSC